MKDYEETEAMRIMFDCARGKRFAVRPFLGGVNGISGLSLFKHMTSLQMDSLRTKQDYVVLPNQERLDGIAIKPGIVRQFVATPTVSQSRRNASSALLPMSGNGHRKSPSEKANETLPASGATIEWQMTGKDTIGGIQLQIVPQFDVKNMHAGNTKDVISSDDKGRLISYADPVPDSALQFDVLKTPRELGLKENDVIHIKDMNQLRQSRRKSIRDLLTEAPNPLKPGDVLELEIRNKSANGVTFNIRGVEPLDQIFSFEVELPLCVRWNLLIRDIESSTGAMTSAISSLLFGQSI
jgi:hypothetical protein